jgi:TPP-dependent pyruvate/acetoin dehydrogenase alpha subunit
LTESASAQLEDKLDNASPKAVGFGFPGITVDGNDAVAVYRVAQEAIERARCGGGPTLIEAQTSRGYRHAEIDPANYRAPTEVEERESTDPIAAMERYLTGKDLFSEAWKNEITEGFQRELDAAIEVAENHHCGASV